MIAPLHELTNQVLDCYKHFHSVTFQENFSARGQVSQHSPRQLSSSPERGTFTSHDYQQVCGLQRSMEQISIFHLAKLSASLS